MTITGKKHERELMDEALDHLENAIETRNPSEALSALETLDWEDQRWAVSHLSMLLLKRLKVDPALASGPILTTCTDMCGFFLVLTFAAATLSHLAGA